LLAVADAVEHAALPGSNLGLVLEHFRGSPHEEIIALLAAQVEADTGDEGEQEVVFTDTIERLRGRDLRRQIDALNAKARAGTLSADERRSLAELLARKSA
jgi:DNA primase